MVGYEFNITRVCFAEELVRIRFCEENPSNPEKKGEKERADAKHVKQYFCI
jgi:hypothetical protein